MIGDNNEKLKFFECVSNKFGVEERESVYVLFGYQQAGKGCFSKT